MIAHLELGTLGEDLDQDGVAQKTAESPRGKLLTRRDTAGAAQARATVPGPSAAADRLRRSGSIPPGMMPARPCIRRGNRIRQYPVVCANILRPKRDSSHFGPLILNRS